MKLLEGISKERVLSNSVPSWVRDEHVRMSMRRVTKRLARPSELHTEPACIVCYGPSLNDTWRDIKDFKYIFSCSGAHKFLVEHGIMPTWHCDVDPRPHKCDLIGTPQKEVQYLIASCCHPNMFKLLERYDVTLWHALRDDEESIRIIPPGEWMIPGGSTIGLRVMTLARFLGFQEIHIFGMDGSCGSSGQHAGAHPNQFKEFAEVTRAGKTYLTNPVLHKDAEATFSRLDNMPDVKAVFHGEGLVQAMATEYVPRHIPSDQIQYGVVKPILISNAHRALQRERLETEPAYGGKGERWASVAAQLMQDSMFTSLLDYGCGHGTLARSLLFPIWEYDPAIPGKEEEPRASDLVACINVLEHVESDKIPAVLSDIRRCLSGIGFFVIESSDVENWKELLGRYFDVYGVEPKGNDTVFVVKRSAPLDQSVRALGIAK